MLLIDKGKKKQSANDLQGIGENTTKRLKTSTSTPSNTKRQDPNTHARGVFGTIRDQFQKVIEMAKSLDFGFGGPAMPGLLLKELDKRSRYSDISLRARATSRLSETHASSQT